MLSIGSLIVLVLLGVANAKYAKYTITIGKNFKEKIYVDTQKGIEIFKVPAIGNLDAAIILNDANRGLRVIKVPKVKTCFLERSSNIRSPKRLKAQLMRIHSHRVSNYLEENRNMYIKGLIENRRNLGRAIRRLCAGYKMKEIAEKRNGNDVSAGQFNVLNRRCPAVRVNNNVAMNNTWDSLLSRTLKTSMPTWLYLHSTSVKMKYDDHPEKRAFCYYRYYRYCYWYYSYGIWYRRCHLVYYLVCSGR